MAIPMIAFTLGSGGKPHNELPPAAASAVTVPREWPIMPMRDTSTRFPNQVVSESITALTSWMRFFMLLGTLVPRWQGAVKLSKQGSNWLWAWALMKSILTSS